MNCCRRVYIGFLAGDWLVICRIDVDYGQTCLFSRRIDTEPLGSSQSMVKSLIELDKPVKSLQPEIIQRQAVISVQYDAFFIFTPLYIRNC
jgi:hypothetical protein